MCGEAETGHRVRCFWLEALEVSSRWLYILSLRLTLIFLFSLLLVVPSIRAPWWGSLSQVGVSVPVAPGGQPQGPGLWDPITPDSHSCKSPMWSLSQAGIHWQDPSPATRWCLGRGACPELLILGRGLRAGPRLWSQHRSPWDSRIICFNFLGGQRKELGPREGKGVQGHYREVVRAL